MWFSNCSASQFGAALTLQSVRLITMSYAYKFFAALTTDKFNTGYKENYILFLVKQLQHFL